VERFNDFARKGCDEDFHRGEHVYEQWMGDPLKAQEKLLGAIETGPFFAVPLAPPLLP